MRAVDSMSWQVDVGPATRRRTRRCVSLATMAVASLLVTASAVAGAERPRAGKAAVEPQDPSNGPDCLPEARSAARVVAVTAAHSVALDDGRLVKLATVSAPAPLVPTPARGATRGRSDSPDGPGSDAAMIGPPETRLVSNGPQTTGDAARAALAALIDGRIVTVHPISAVPDRHGRLRAHLVMEDGRSVAAALVQAGRLRVEPSRDDFACARVLLAREAEARATGRGFWAEPDAATLSAEDPTLVEKAGRYVVVEGRVLSTGRAGTRTYLNFGRRFASDFTAVIDDKEMPRFQSAGFSPARLEGRTIRVRGWLTARDGGFMALSVPEEIEWVR